MRTTALVLLASCLASCVSTPPTSPSAPAPGRRGPAGPEQLVHVQRIAADDPLLWVDFAALAPDVDDALAARVLSGIESRIADLALARTRVGDATLALCARMPELRSLDLRGSRVTARGIALLSGCTKLARLSLVDTRLGDGSVEAIAALPGLRRVDLWLSEVDPAALARLRGARPELRIELGAALETAVLEEEPPPRIVKAERGAPVPVPVNTLCPVSQKPVVAGHSLVDEGKTIGFCCEKCLAKFRASPESFRAALR